MANRFALLLISLLVLGFVVAGCGDDDDDDSASGGDTTAAETTQESTKEEESGGGDATDPAVQQAVDDCKASVNAQSTLSAGVKKDLEEICEKAASGDADDVREAAKDVCIKIVEETVPAGAARDQAVDACNQATATG